MSGGGESDATTAWLAAFTRSPEFLARYPYYAAVLARVSPVVDPSVALMAVSLHGGRYYLHVNVEAFVREPHFLRGILLHEVHHIVLGHLAHPKFHDALHPDLMEIAEEISANEHIEEPLPDPITWKLFERQGIRPGQSTLTRYEKLVAARQAQGNAFRPQFRAVDHHPWSPREGGKPAPRGATAQTQKLLGEAMADGKEAAEQASKLMPKAGLVAGVDPGRLLEALADVRSEPLTYVDWKNALSAFAGLRRAPVTSWSRPSRRHRDRIGQVPGRAWRLRPVERPHLMVVIDTSMSMTDAELAEVARHLVKVSALAQLTIVQCDTEITAVHPFEGALERVHGRGGTDLRPPFEAPLLARMRPDGVVVFTDGVGPVPEAPPSMPVLWVLTKPERFDCPWGARTRFSGRRSG
jgi:predicted metal-dependent peptidase